jgi:hypothetical protein
VADVRRLIAEVVVGSQSSLVPLSLEAGMHIPGSLEEECKRVRFGLKIHFWCIRQYGKPCFKHVHFWLFRGRIHDNLHYRRRHARGVTAYPKER